MKKKNLQKLFAVSAAAMMAVTNVYPALAAEETETVETMEKETETVVEDVEETGETELSDGEEENLGPMLIIVTGESMTQVPYEGEADGEALVDAIEEETGWNLSLAGIEYYDHDSWKVTVKFADDSLLYSPMMEEQKEPYAVADKQELVYAAFNTIQSTFMYNLGCEKIYFASSDDGRIDIDEDGFSLHLSGAYAWNTIEGYEMTQQELPEDSIGIITPLFEPYSMGGIGVIQFIFNRPGLERGTGSFCVYDENNEVFAQADVQDEDAVILEEPDQSDLDNVNYMQGTLVTFVLDKTLETGKEYHFGMSEGLLKYGDIGNKEVASDIWTIQTTDYGIERITEGETLKIGETVEYKVELGETGDRTEISLDDPEAGELSAAELTESGTFTFTPSKAGDLEMYCTIYAKDGSYAITLLTEEVEE